MSDQQRLLLAAVLMSAALFAGWVLGRRAPSPAPVTVAETTGADTAGTEAPAVPDFVPEDGEHPPEREVTVVVPGPDGGITATLSTRGGCVTSWVLEGWRDMTSGAPADLCTVPWFEARADRYPVAFSYDGPDTVYVEAASRIEFRSDSGTRIYEFVPGERWFTVSGDAWGPLSVPPGTLPVTEEEVDAGNYFSASWYAEKQHNRKSRQTEEQTATGRVLWMATRSRYFTVIMLSPEGDRSEGTLLPADDAGSPGIAVQSPVLRIYAGPVEYGALERLGSRTDGLVDFGWPLIRWIGRLIYLFTARLLDFAGNWGVRIIILSVTLKLLLWPLSSHSTRSMKRMQAVQPLLAELQRKYASDPLRLRQEMAKLYKEQGVSPLGGCLPILLQMPIFFAMYSVLQNAVELRGAGFLLWITDLSRPEILLPFGTKVLGMAGLGLLPVLMGLAMFVQQKASVTDPNQKMMVYVMPVFMTWLFMRFPSGLTLYWFVNNVLTIAEQKLLYRREAARRTG
jgi:YidC/Oxa1 family membrane protein insertase